MVWPGMKHIILSVLALAAVTACSSATITDREGLAGAAADQTASRNDTLTIRLGESVVADGGRLEVRFDERVADSRCPATAVCVWAGDAHVRVTTRVAGGTPAKSDLHSGLQPNKLVVDRYSITLIGMTPYPGSGPQDATPVLYLHLGKQ